MDEPELLSANDLKNLTSGATADAGQTDKIVDQSLVLMARYQDEFFAVGTSFVLSNVESTNGNPSIAIAVTAKHSITNIPKHFAEVFQCSKERFMPQSSVEPPWTLVAGNKNGGLWQCIWGRGYVDDLQLLYLVPANDEAKRTIFFQPLIGFGLPEIGDEIWGMGFANSCYDPHPEYDFSTDVKLTKGNIVQLDCGESYKERVIAALPLVDGMSGGPVFWAKMLFGIISSTFGADQNGVTSFVMRVRHLWHLPIDDAPEINGVSYKTCGDLHKAGMDIPLRSAVSTGAPRPLVMKPIGLSLRSDDGI